MKKILVVDDENFTARLLTRKFERTVEVVWMENLASAREVFDARRGEFDAIVLDGNVEGAAGDTLPLLEYFLAQGFSGEIIAFSSDPVTVAKMIMAGATFGLEKIDVMKLIEFLESK